MDLHQDNEIIGVMQVYKTKHNYDSSKSTKQD